MLLKIVWLHDIWSLSYFQHNFTVLESSGIYFHYTTLILELWIKRIIHISKITVSNTISWIWCFVIQFKSFVFWGDCDLMKNRLTYCTSQLDKMEIEKEPIKIIIKLLNYIIRPQIQEIVVLKIILLSRMKRKGVKKSFWIIIQGSKVGKYYRYSSI